MRNIKKEGTFLLFIIFIILLGLGFATLSSNLSIDGTANINSASWNIYCL